MRSIMIDSDDDSRYNLFCYEGDDVIWEQTFNTQADAVAFGNRYLNGEFKQGFEVTE